MERNGGPFIQTTRGNIIHSLLFLRWVAVGSFPLGHVNPLAMEAHLLSRGVGFKAAWSRMFSTVVTARQASYVKIGSTVFRRFLFIGPAICEGTLTVFLSDSQARVVWQGVSLLLFVERS